MEEAEIDNLCSDCHEELEQTEERAKELLSEWLEEKESSPEDFTDGECECGRTGLLKNFDGDYLCPACYYKAEKSFLKEEASVYCNYNCDDCENYDDDKKDCSKGRL